MNKNQAQHDFTGNSFIISTPKPTASSTIEKRHFPPIINQKYRPSIINYSLNSEDDGRSVESLGILSLEDVDLTPQLEHPRKKDAVEDESFSRLKAQRLLAQKTLNKVKSGLPSRFLVPSDSYESITENVPKCESTVSETDLLKNATPAREVRNSYFNPNDISTPRNSNISEEQKAGSISLFEDMTHISEKIRNSDVSLKELCSQFGKFSVGSEQNISEISSQMFKPAELVGDKLMEDELSWRKEYGFLCSTDESRKESFLSSTVSDLQIEKCSVGNFFIQKSDEVLNIFKTSPERKDPVPLIDLTNTLHETHNERTSTRALLEDSQNITSILSASRIAKIISSADSQDSPNKVINYLLKSKESKDKSSIKIREYANDVQKNLEDTDDLKKSRNDDDEDVLSSKSSEEYALDSSSEKQDSTEKNSSDENKENYSRLTDRSTYSTGTASSLSTLPEGKFPIKSTHTELAWGCVKLLRCNTQEFFIRNQLNQRIRMQASITGLCFRILKDRTDSDMLTTITFLLHPMETKSFYVCFCPTTLGSFCEKLQFYPIINGEIQSNKKQTLALYGYGGHVSLDIPNIAKDSNNKRWLSLGTVHHKTMVTKKFTIKNNGTLNAFVCIDVHSKGLYAFSVIYVQPNELTLRPQEEASVTITFTPAKKDFLNSVTSEVIEIGLLKVIHGPEPLRGRLRRLCTKLKQKGEIPDPILERLSAYFPEETMPADLKVFKETVGVTKELLQQLMVKEIIITVEQDLESTLIGHMDIDETSIYQTLGPNNSNFSMLENETLRETKCCFKVEPLSILLTPPSKTEDVIFIHSENVNPMHFEAVVEPPGVFQVHPRMGTIASKGEVFLKICCSKIIGRVEGKVSVFVENDVIEINVKCIFVKSQ